MNLSRIPVVVISFAMIFTGFAGFAGLGVSSVSPKSIEKVEIVNVPNEHIRIIHGNIYKVLDGGLYQDLKTGKYCTSYNWEE